MMCFVCILILSLNINEFAFSIGTLVYQVNICWNCYSYTLHLKVVTFLVSVLFKSCLFSESPLGYLGELEKNWLAATCGFFGI